jgi:hypothetical protein
MRAIVIVVIASDFTIDHSNETGSRDNLGSLGGWITTRKMVVISWFRQTGSRRNFGSLGRKYIAIVTMDNLCLQGYISPRPLLPLLLKRR